MGKRNACNVEGCCIVGRALLIILLLQVLEGVGSLGNEAVECNDNFRTRSEEGSVAQDAVEM
jgi:hypothetical protein